MPLGVRKDCDPSSSSTSSCIEVRFIKDLVASISALVPVGPMTSRAGAPAACIASISPGNPAVAVGRRLERSSEETALCSLSLCSVAILESDSEASMMRSSCGIRVEGVVPSSPVATKWSCMRLERRGGYAARSGRRACACTTRECRRLESVGESSRHETQTPLSRVTHACPSPATPRPRMDQEATTTNRRQNQT